MIRKTGPREWTLFTRDGARVLGKHPTKAKAEAQERAVEASKRRPGAKRRDNFRVRAEPE